MSWNIGKINTILFMMWLFTCAENSDSGSKEDIWVTERNDMVEMQIARRGVRDEMVLNAMRSVPRHLFVPEKYRSESYRDGPLPIGNDQTISQPYIVAFMTEMLKIDSTSKILEVGTGSGYQAAVLAEIADSVYSIEIIDNLAQRANRLIDSLGYGNVTIRSGDGYLGWPEAAPFDAIIITAAAPRIPEPLIEQLKPEGRMVVPVGDYSQDLMLVTKSDTGTVKKSTIPVRFVPMTGKIRK